MNKTKKTAKPKKVLYKPFKSTKKGKKYSVYVKSKSGNPKLIHFGSLPYQHYFDKGGLYKHLNHKDPKRRKSYHARHGKKTDKNTPGYWASFYLW